VAMEAKALPAEFALSQNFPNPFNSATIVKYRLPEESYVSLSVYNTQGQLVRTLVESRQEPGYKSVRWDGGDESNREVAAGIYLYHIQAGKFSQARRMLLLK
ncbi:MAG: T9SS type A sorting domain-containing protein, partial [Candidatus Latescibacteria bacterium]|nr:T9SS type A sorting domain-containing protein [Candidatus Latescibacterota bacterium]